MNTPGSFECECFDGYESGFMMMKNCMGKCGSPGSHSPALHPLLGEQHALHGVMVDREETSCSPLLP